MLLFICSIIDHRWRQNVVRTKKWHTRRSRVCHWCVTLSMRGRWRKLRELNMGGFKGSQCSWWKIYIFSQESKIWKIKQSHFTLCKRRKIHCRITFALLSEQLLQKKVDQDDTIWHVIWDFAGQDIYRAIHPIFMPSKDNLPPRFWSYRETKCIGRVSSQCGPRRRHCKSPR